MNIRDLWAELMTLSVYRPLLAQPVLAEMRRLLDCLVKGYGEDAIDAYTSLFYTLRSAGYTSWETGCGTACVTTTAPMPSWWKRAAATRFWSTPPTGKCTSCACWPTPSATSSCLL